MRSPVQKRQGNRVFSRVSTGESDFPSSCEMKDEPVFKILQGNPAFFPCRASRYALHLRRQIQDPSHIPIAEGRLLLRRFGNVAYLFNRILGISSPREDMEGLALSSSSCAEIGVPIYLRRVSQGISVVAQRMPSHLYCMMGKEGLL